MRNEDVDGGGGGGGGWGEWYWWKSGCCDDEGEGWESISWIVNEPLPVLFVIND